MKDTNSKNLQELPISDLHRLLWEVDIDSEEWQKIWIELERRRITREVAKESIQGGGDSSGGGAVK